MVCKESKEAKSVKTNKQANKQTISTHWYGIVDVAACGRGS